MLSALAALELGVGGSANLSAYSSDAEGEIGFGFIDESGLEVYFDLWDARERASHTLGKSDAYVNEAGLQSSTWQEAKDGCSGLLHRCALAIKRDGRSQVLLHDIPMPTSFPSTRA